MSSAGTIDADVNITINAEDQATVKVESAARRINRQWREMRLEQRAVQQSFELSNRKFTATARVLGQLGSVMLRVQSVFNSYQLSQIRMQDATRNLAEAKRKLSEAIIENGLNSKEAIEAQEDVTQFEQRKGQAQVDDIFQKILGAGVVASLVSRVPGLSAALKNLQNVLKPNTTTATTKITDFADDAAKKGGGRGAGFLSRAAGAVTGGLSKIPLGGVGAGAIGLGVGVISDFQTAGDADLPEGLDAFGPLGNKLTGDFHATVNIFANTSQEIVDSIQTGLEDIFRFGGN